MLNGHRLNSYSTNAASPDFSISLEKVKQIEEKNIDCHFANFKNFAFYQKPTWKRKSSQVFVLNIQENSLKNSKKQKRGYNVVSGVMDSVGIKEV